MGSLKDWVSLLVVMELVTYSLSLPYSLAPRDPVSYGGTASILGSGLQRTKKEDVGVRRVFPEQASSQIRPQLLGSSKC